MDQVSLIHGFSDSTHRYLTSLGICGSKGYVRLNEIDAVNDKLTTGWDFAVK